MSACVKGFPPAERLSLWAALGRQLLDLTREPGDPESAADRAGALVRWFQKKSTMGFTLDR